MSKKRRSSAQDIRVLRAAVGAHYREHGRHDLPWRKTVDPYKILVSEMMLQQTQVPRVIEKYKSFLKEFPSIRSLARAELSQVIRAWSGLGYNRRGKYLHDAAKQIVALYKGKIPKEVPLLRKLPGLGPYSASAIRVFAFNMPDALMETNVRSVYIHHFFPSKKKVSDAMILPLAHTASNGQDPRTWHWALMDYGVHLKRLHQNPTRRSSSYVMQSKFVGSLREIRGAVIKLLSTGAHGDLAIAQKLSFDGKRTREALMALKRDGLVTSSKGSWRIA